VTRSSGSRETSWVPAMVQQWAVPVLRLLGDIRGPAPVL